MRKDELLKQVWELANRQMITKEELLEAFDKAQNGQVESSGPKRLSISDVLYYIGGAVVFFGVGIFITQLWPHLSDITRVLSTLGAGIALYASGALFSQDERLDKLGTAFHFMAALVMPLGVYVTFKVSGFHMETHQTQSLVSFIMLVTYLLSYTIYKKPLFVVFSLIYGGWLFYSFTGFLLNEQDWWSSYRFLGLGLSYLFCGYYFSKTSLASLAGPLYGFGSFFFLGAALWLGGWRSGEKMVWEIIYPGLVFGVMFVSVYLKSKAMLTFASLYLMAYILKITSEYFSQSLGWPVTLMLAGASLIAIGFFHVKVQKKYLSQ